MFAGLLETADSHRILVDDRTYIKYSLLWKGHETYGNVCEVANVSIQILLDEQQWNWYS